MRRIDEYFTSPSQSSTINFVQQTICSRILASSLSVFAFIDISYHLTCASLQGMQSIYLKLKNRNEPINFYEAHRHLKIARLFRSVLLIGSLQYFISPEEVSNFQVNELTKFVRALLLGNAPEILKNPSESGGTTLRGVLDHFCALVNELPQEIQESTKETIALIREAQDFINAGINYQLDNQNDSIINSALHKLNEEFLSIISKNGIFKEIELRAHILGSAIILSCLYISYPFFLYINLVLFFVKFIHFMIYGDPAELKKQGKMMGLEMIFILRFLVSIPFIFTYGMYDPIKFKTLFLAPLVDSKNTMAQKSRSHFFKKLENLKENEKIVLALRIYVPQENNLSGHGYYIHVTKKLINYRLSIINCGWGSEHHILRESEKRDVDYSLDNISLDYLKNYITLLLEAGSSKIQGVIDVSKQKGYNLELVFKEIIYGTLKGTSSLVLNSMEVGQPIGAINFESTISSSTQKIGNCGIKSLLALILFDSVERNGNRDAYKRFRNSFRKLVYHKYNYLLDFDFNTKRGLKEYPSEILAKQYRT